jgi:peptide/nickel transport system substrate-binding protein
MRLKSWRWLAALGVAVTLGAGLLSTAPGAAAAAGSSLIVLEPATTGGTWSNLDPLTDTTAAANWDILNPIYGELFEEGPGGKIVPDLATGYKVVDNGLEVDITLRPGVTFSDGTPFNAAAVVFNFQRDLNKTAACLCLENFGAVSSVNAIGNDEVALHLSQVDPAIIDAFIAEAPDWIVSPSALSKLGAQAFSLTPVGAGPFTVTSDTPNSKLVLAANPHYWQAGYPKVAHLTFTSVGSDTSALEAMQAGQGQIYASLTSVSSLATAKSSFEVVPVPATETDSVNLNPTTAPFNNILAREAIYYATDAATINKAILDGTGTVSESPTGPGDLFWTPTVPGYRTYNPAKAKALVKQLGGISFTLSTIQTPVYVPLVEAYKSLWAQVGINATISFLTIPQIVKETENGTMQAIATQVGSFDPALLPGLGASYSSTGPFSLVKDKTLDGLIDTANTQSNRGEEGQDYQKIFSYLNQQAYAPFLFTSNAWRVQTKSVGGIPANVAEVAWQDVTVGS